MQKSSLNSALVNMIPWFLHGFFFTIIVAHTIYLKNFQIFIASNLVLLLYILIFSIKSNNIKRFKLNLLNLDVIDKQNHPPPFEVFVYGNNPEDFLITNVEFISSLHNNRKKITLFIPKKAKPSIKTNPNVVQNEVTLVKVNDNQYFRGLHKALTEVVFNIESSKYIILISDDTVISNFDIIPKLVSLSIKKNRPLINLIPEVLSKISTRVGYQRFEQRDISTPVTILETFSFRLALSMNYQIKSIGDWINTISKILKKRKIPIFLVTSKYISTAKKPALEVYDALDFFSGILPPLLAWNVFMEYLFSERHPTLLVFKIILLIILIKYFSSFEDQACRGITRFRSSIINSFYHSISIVMSVLRKIWRLIRKSEIQIRALLFLLFVLFANTSGLIYYFNDRISLKVCLTIASFFILIEIIRESLAFNLAIESIRPPVTRNDFEDIKYGTSMIIPIKNEELVIEATIQSILDSQTNAKIWLVDDNSTDNTPRLIQKYIKPPMVNLVDRPKLRPGWLGKANSIWEATRIESVTRNQWLLVSDADLRYKQNSIEKIIAIANQKKVDYLTGFPMIITNHIADDFLFMLNWRRDLLLTKLNSRFHSGAMAIGAIYLVKIDSYLFSGGHSLDIGRHPEEDLLLSRLKKIGANTCLINLSNFVSIRPYTSITDGIKNQILKAHFNASKGSKFFQIFKLSHHIIQFLFPPVIFTGFVFKYYYSNNINWIDYGICATALLSVLISAFSFLQLKYYSTIRLISVCLFPIAVFMSTIFVIIGITLSIIKADLSWRGRKI